MCAVTSHPELVQLLVSTHNNVDCLSAQHNAMLECVELRRSRDQSWILAFDSDLLLHADVLAFIFECAVGLIVMWCSRTAKGHCQTVADAEASERLLLGLLGFQSADFEDKGSIEYEQVEGDGGW